MYGLGANALDEGAVLKVFRYKGRPLSDPLIVHVPGATEARKLLQLPPSVRNTIDVDGPSVSRRQAQTSVTPAPAPCFVLRHSPQCDRLFDVLTAAFWPGPLTVVSRASKDIPMKGAAWP